MAIIIDFRSRRPLPQAENFAVLDIVECEQDHDNRVLFDGLAPRALIEKIRKICDEHNAGLQ